MVRGIMSFFMLCKSSLLITFFPRASNPICLLPDIKSVSDSTLSTIFSFTASGPVILLAKMTASRMASLLNLRLKNKPFYSDFYLTDSSFGSQKRDYKAYSDMLKLKTYSNIS
jgi:hypothetical protein